MSTDPEELVLIAEDEPNFLDTLAEIISGEDVGVIACDSVESAMGHLDKKGIFLIISDFSFGDKESGIDFLKKVRKIDAEIPFVIMSGNADKKLAFDCVHHGATDIIEKPIPPKLLTKIIEKYRMRRKKDLLDKINLQNVFIEEANLLLEGIEVDIIKLENQSGSHEVVDKIFRIIHTIKGGCHALENNKIVLELSHNLENLLSLLSEDRISIDKDLGSLILEVSDLIRNQINDLESHHEPSHLATDLLSKMEIYQKNALPTKNKRAPKPSGETPLKEQESDKGIFVSSEKLEEFMKMAGELVAFKNIFQGFKQHHIEFDENIRTSLDDMDHNLSKISDQIQVQIMEILKVPLSSVFNKFIGIVRKISISQKKSIHLNIEGGDLEVDKTITRILSNSLVHVIRNSCDHGIEPPDIRKEKGKPVTGTITITAKQVDEMITIIVSDDGKGLSEEVISEKAIQKGLANREEIATMKKGEILSYIFKPGFSTANQISDVSGRGVGMDAVKTAIEGANGTIKIDSKPDHYTRFNFEIPVPKTVMIEQTVIIRSSDYLLAIPVNCIEKISDVDKNLLKFTDIGWTYIYQDGSIPIAMSEEYINVGSDRNQNLKSNSENLGTMVVIVEKNKKIAIRVLEVLYQVETVVRPFDDIIGKIPGFKGISQLANDDVVYVVSGEEFVNMVVS